MGLHRFQISAAADTLLPRDRFINTLYLDHTAVLEDLDATCLDLANLWQTQWYVGAREIEVRAYDVGGNPPHFPVGDAKINAGLSPATPGCRELAICLSYYAERNLPRQRGRMFLPAAPAAMSIGTLRPSTTNLTKVMTLANGIAAIGGADVDWKVWSPTTQQSHEVTHAWVDDEWDIMRSRGLRATTRQLVATGS